MENFDDKSLPVAAPLLEWYAVHKRDLEFRKSRQAYNIWVSEIMAQQTRIEAMLPYYRRFIEKYPDMKALAKANEDDLHKIWQGLGYYSRIRNMHKCAVECVKKYEGNMPSTKKELLELPGIGPYTAGAIASIAFNERVSAVDGNVLRVFSRLYAYKEDVLSSKGKKYIEKKVDLALPDTKDVSAFNQALMDLGAMICIPKSPRCLQCPLNEICKGYKLKIAEKLPVKKKKNQRTIEDKNLYIYICFSKEGWKVHMKKREQKGLLHNMYGFEENKREDFKIRKESLDLGSYTHVFSHKEWNMKGTVYYTDNPDDSFYTLKDIRQHLAVPSAFMPFIERLEKLEEEYGKQRSSY